jgi:hypothetical protein
LEERLEELADLRKSYGKVADNIKESQDRQKKLYDAKHGASKSFILAIVLFLDKKFKIYMGGRIS